MSQAPAPAQTQARQVYSDGGGKSRQLVYAGAGYAVAAGVVSLVIGLMNVAHVAGSILGSTGMVVGLLAQMMSVTRNERIVIVFGITVAFVGMGLGFAHGGFS